MIASGDLPDILMVGYSATYLAGSVTDCSGKSDLSSTIIRTWQNSIRFIMTISKVDGKVYGIPNFRTLARWGIIYRKDSL